MAAGAKASRAFLEPAGRGTYLPHRLRICAAAASNASESRICEACRTTRLLKIESSSCSTPRNSTDVVTADILGAAPAPRSFSASISAAPAAVKRQCACRRVAKSLAAKRSSWTCAAVLGESAGRAAMLWACRSSAAVTAKRNAGAPCNRRKMLVLCLPVLGPTTCSVVGASTVDGSQAPPAGGGETSTGSLFSVSEIINSDSSGIARTAAARGLSKWKSCSSPHSAAKRGACTIPDLRQTVTRNNRKSGPAAVSRHSLHQQHPDILQQQQLQQLQ